MALDGGSPRYSGTRWQAKASLTSTNFVSNCCTRLQQVSVGLLQLFDNALAALDGRPAGQQMNDTLRKVQQFTRMLSLRNSGIYQLSEYATAMGRFGVLKTVKYAAKNMPGFRSLLSGADKAGGKQLQDILARVRSRAKTSVSGRSCTGSRITCNQRWR